jgi:predicted Zn-dependent protease
VLRGKLLLRENRAADAAAAFREAVTANPDEPTPRYLLATTLRQMGAAEDSKRQFEAFRTARDKEKTRKFRTLVVEIQRRDEASR